MCWCSGVDASATGQFPLVLLLLVNAVGLGALGGACVGFSPEACGHLTDVGTLSS
jgi:hypothetical protein